jgi:hypothetical protein
VHGRFASRGCCHERIRSNEVDERIEKVPRHVCFAPHNRLIGAKPLPPKADIAAHYRHVRFVPKADIAGHSLRLPGRSHDKLWRERQIAFVRYSLLNDRKDFLNIRMVDLATAASVLRHILDHRQ